MNQREVANVILIVGVVVIAALAGYFVLMKGEPVQRVLPLTASSTPMQIPVTQPPTSALEGNPTTWKTYRDETYRFEVKYPPDWYVSYASHPLGYSFDNRVNKIQSLEFTEKIRPELKDTDVQGFFGVIILKDTLDRDLGTLLSTYEHENTAKKSKNSVDISLGGNPARKLSIASGDFTASQIFTINNNVLFVLYFVQSNPNDSNEEMHSRIYDQILSTFKFTR